MCFHMHQELANIFVHFLYQRYMYSLVQYSYFAFQCYSSSEVMEVFQLSSDSEISHDDFLSLCPALLQQAVEGCIETEVVTDDTSDDLTDAEGTTLYHLCLPRCTFYSSFNCHNILYKYSF